jgi:hypothetical protein
MRHWSDDDNLIAYCLHRLGNKEHTFGIEPTELGQILGMGYNSLSIKVANFKAIEGAGGMEGYSKQAERIERRYRDMSDGQLRAAGIEGVGRALNKYTTRA